MIMLIALILPIMRLPVLEIIGDACICFSCIGIGAWTISLLHNLRYKQLQPLGYSVGLVLTLCGLMHGEAAWNELLNPSVSISAMVMWLKLITGAAGLAANVLAWCLSLQTKIVLRQATGLLTDPKQSAERNKKIESILQDAQILMQRTDPSKT